MGEIMNSPKGVKSGVPERVSTCHYLHQITGNQSYVTVGEQTLQHRGVTFVNKVCMTTIEFPKSSLKFP